MEAWGAMVDSVASNFKRRDYILVLRWYDTFNDETKKRQIGKGFVPLAKLEELNKHLTGKGILPLRSEASPPDGSQQDDSNAAHEQAAAQETS